MSPTLEGMPTSFHLQRSPCAYFAERSRRGGLAASFFFVIFSAVSEADLNPIFFISHLDNSNLSAMYQGATRVRTMDVSVDGILVTTWTSSGTTSDFENIDLSGYAGQDVTITGVLADSEWLSIVEVRQATFRRSNPVSIVGAQIHVLYCDSRVPRADHACRTTQHLVFLNTLEHLTSPYPTLPLSEQTEIMVLSDGVTPPPSPTAGTPAPVYAPVATPTPTPVVPTPEQLYSAKEVGTVGTVTTSATLFDPSLSEDDGCDPSGCTAALTRVSLLFVSLHPSTMSTVSSRWFMLKRGAPCHTSLVLVVARCQRSNNWQAVAGQRGVFETVSRCACPRAGLNVWKLPLELCGVYFWLTAECHALPGSYV